MSISRDEERTKLVDFDHILASVGGYGRYQVSAAILLFVAAMLSGSVTLMNVFSMAQPEFRCFVPECDSKVVNKSFLTFSTPQMSIQGFDTCHIYGFNEDIFNSSIDCSRSDFNRSSITECDGYLFSDEYYESSVVSDFELVCNKAWQVPLAQTIFFFTAVIASPITGQLATSIGRKPVIIMGLALMAIGSLILPFVSSYISFLALQVPVSAGQTAVFTNTVLLAVECVQQQHSVMTSSLQQVAFTFGQLALATVAFFVRKWRQTQLIMAFPIALWTLLSFWLCESPRWLLTQNKIIKTSKVLRRIAKINGNEAPATLEEDLENLALLEMQEELATSSSSSESMLDVLKNARMMTRLITLWFVWFSVSLAFYGLSLNTASLAADPYLTFALTAFIEIPAYAMAQIGMQRMGRKLTVGLGLIKGALSLFTTILPLSSFLSILVFISGKLFVTGAFGAIYLHTAELMPTTTRSVAVSTCNMFGRIGATVAPSIALTSVVFSSMPLLIMATLTMVAGILVLVVLPETKNKVLPETMQEALVIGKKKHVVSEATPILQK